MDTIPQNTPQKQCTKCNRVFPATKAFFHADKTGKYGLVSRCKECVKKKLQQHYQAHRVEILAYVKEYTQIHKEEISIYQKTYGQTHRTEVNANARKFRKEHPESQRTNVRNRRARKRNNGGTHTVTDIQKQYKAQKGKCYYCNIKVGKGKYAYHVDHVIPVSRGGSNSPENLVIACPDCNRKKNDKLPHEWHQGGRLM